MYYCLSDLDTDKCSKLQIMIWHEIRSPVVILLAFNEEKLQNMAYYR